MLKQLTRGERYLVTMRNFIYGQDGRQYRAVFGTVNNIDQNREPYRTAAQTNEGDLPCIVTDRGNVTIGNVTILERDITGIVECNNYSGSKTLWEAEHEGTVHYSTSQHSWILNGDGFQKVPFCDLDDSDKELIRIFSDSDDIDMEPEYFWNDELTPDNQEVFLLEMEYTERLEYLKTLGFEIS